MRSLLRALWKLPVATLAYLWNKALGLFAMVSPSRRNSRDHGKDQGRSPRGTSPGRVESQRMSISQRQGDQGSQHLRCEAPPRSPSSSTHSASSSRHIHSRSAIQHPTKAPATTQLYDRTAKLPPEQFRSTLPPGNRYSNSVQGNSVRRSFEYPDGNSTTRWELQADHRSANRNDGVLARNLLRYKDSLTKPLRKRPSVHSQQQPSPSSLRETANNAGDAAASISVSSPVQGKKIESPDTKSSNAPQGDVSKSGKGNSAGSLGSSPSQPRRAEEKNDSSAAVNDRGKLDKAALSSETRVSGGSGDGQATRPEQLTFAQRSLLKASPSKASTITGSIITTESTEIYDTVVDMVDVEDDHDLRVAAESLNKRIGDFASLVAGEWEDSISQEISPEDVTPEPIKVAVGPENAALVKDTIGPFLYVHVAQTNNSLTPQERSEYLEGALRACIVFYAVECSNVFYVGQRARHNKRRSEEFEMLRAGMLLIE